MSRSAVPAKRPASDAAEAAWIADEDRFVLQQAKKKAFLRAKGGRASPIDWLAVTLCAIEPERNELEDEVDVEDMDLREPESVFEDLDIKELAELEKGIDGYLALESWRGNVEFWQTMKAICTDRRTQISTSTGSRSAARGVSSVAGDLDKLLGPKTLAELEKLEKQIKGKLASNEPIDTDYWEHLLRSLLTYKARAKLRKVTEKILESRVEGLRRQQVVDAETWKDRLNGDISEAAEDGDATEDRPSERKPNGTKGERHSLDPEPLLRLRPEDKQLESMTDEEFASRVADERAKVRKQGFIPGRGGKRLLDSSSSSALGEPSSKRQRTDSSDPGAGQSSAQAAFDRDLARGLQGNEELLTTEVPVSTKGMDRWSSEHRPRKPRYFARVQTGYEWNKYNQTHYDADNPPPKVVQGYKFNILYPDLLDKTKAPTYKIEREGGRRRGELTAPAGQDDECTIRFIAGPPYEDVAFRIVDKEWDYSAKRERGFKSSFDKGVLQVWVMFKKIYYRK